jgi:O-succinylbenzoic acid--CoA ligase
MAGENLTCWLQRIYVSHPAAAAVYLADKTLSYAELGRVAEELARQLAARGVGKGNIVAVSTDSPWLTTLLLYATSRLGAVLYPLDPAMPLPWRHRLLAQTDADYLAEQNTGNCTPGTHLPALEISAIGGSKGAGRRVSEASVIVATSGSSGEPRGVVLGHRSIAASALAVTARLGLGPADCWLNCLPLYHVGGLSIVYRAASVGASMVLHHGFDAELVWRDINRFPVSCISLVPVMLQQLLDLSCSAPPPRALRVALVGGAALSETLARRAIASGWPLSLTYGMSETASQVATRCLSEGNGINKIGDFAAPLLDGVECEVVDETGKPATGEGRIRLRGECLMLGYANALRRTGDGLDDDGWFTTGDLGLLDENARLRVTGRADDILISGGEKINPHAVEALLLDCPGVDAVCVVGIADSAWGQKVCAIYSGTFHELRLEQWCRERVVGASRPRKYVRLERLPRLSNGKIDRAVLKNGYGS